MDSWSPGLISSLKYKGSTVNCQLRAMGYNATFSANQDACLGLSQDGCDTVIATTITMSRFEDALRDLILQGDSHSRCGFRVRQYPAPFLASYIPCCASGPLTFQRFTRGRYYLQEDRAETASFQCKSLCCKLNIFTGAKLLR